MSDLTQKHFQEQTQDLHQIQEQIQTQGLKIERMDIKMDQMLTLLTGNELDKDSGGMIKTVSNHEIRIASLEKFRDRLMMGLIVSAFFAGYGVWELVDRLMPK